MQTEDGDHLDDFLRFNQQYKKAGFFKQVRILLEKNIVVTCCKWNFLMAHFVTLTLVCVVILFINFLTRYSYENEPSRIYDVENVSNIQKCDFHPSCKSFGYILIGERKPWIDYTLQDIANKTGLNPDTDFKLLYQGQNITQALTDIKKKNSNSFATITILCTSE